MFIPYHRELYSHLILENIKYEVLIKRISLFP